MEVFYSSGVINDVTGRWRLSRTTSAESVADHALEYYQQMFSSDDEVHAVWNVTLGTMTSIRTGVGCLFVETHEYVDGEENDAEKLFSGKVLSEKVVNISTGEVSDVNSEDVSDSAASALPIAAGIAGATSPPIMTEAPATPAPTQKPVPAETSYVLNTSTMKFHSPGCRDVGKINAGNRQDYTGTRDSVIAMGYSPCGHCNP